MSQAGRVTSRASRRWRSLRSDALPISARRHARDRGSVILEPGLTIRISPSLPPRASGSRRPDSAPSRPLTTMCRWSRMPRRRPDHDLPHRRLSIPGSGAITGDHLLKMTPHVSFHINGGPTAMPDADFERIILESDDTHQVCTAGNLRTTLLCARLAMQHGAFDRFIVATDTPTGSGIMPLGMLTRSHTSPASPTCRQSNPYAPRPAATRRSTT